MCTCAAMAAHLSWLPPGRRSRQCPPPPQALSGRSGTPLGRGTHSAPRPVRCRRSRLQESGQAGRRGQACGCGPFRASIAACFIHGQSDSKRCAGCVPEPRPPVPASDAMRAYSVQEMPTKTPVLAAATVCSGPAAASASPDASSTSLQSSTTGWLSTQAKAAIWHSGHAINRQFYGSLLF